MLHNHAAYWKPESYSVLNAWLGEEYQKPLRKDRRQKREKYVTRRGNREIEIHHHRHALMTFLEDGRIILDPYDSQSSLEFLNMVFAFGGVSRVLGNFILHTGRETVLFKEKLTLKVDEYGTLKILDVPIPYLPMRGWPSKPLTEFFRRATKQAKAMERLLGGDVPWRLHGRPANTSLRYGQDLSHTYPMLQELINDYPAGTPIPTEVLHAVFGSSSRAYAQQLHAFNHIRLRPAEAVRLGNPNMVLFTKEEAEVYEREFALWAK